MEAILDGRIVIELLVFGAGFIAGTILGHRLGARVGSMVSALEARLAAIEHMLGIGGSASAPRKTAASVTAVPAASAPVTAPAAPTPKA